MPASCWPTIAEHVLFLRLFRQREIISPRETPLKMCAASAAEQAGQMAKRAGAGRRRASDNGSAGSDKPHMSHFSEVLSCDLNDRLRTRHIPLCATTLPYLSHDARAD
jgi:hypothetical protein